MNNFPTRIILFLKALSAFAIVGAVIGGTGSFYTGHAQDLPKFNGLEYLFFCAKLGVWAALLIGIVPSIYFAVTKNKMEPNGHGQIKKTTNSKNLFWLYFMSLLLMFIGFSWRKDIQTKGYYVDGKHQIAIYGDDGLITVYALIAGGFLMLAYCIYLSLRKAGKNQIKMKG